MEQHLDNRNFHRIDEVKCFINDFQKMNKQIIYSKNIDINLVEDNIKQLINNMHYRESPDGLSFINDKPFIVEHFSFDCSKNNGRGSEFRKKDNVMIKKSFKNFSKNTALIENEDSIDNYFTNLKYGFEKHCDNWNKYVNNIYDSYSATDKRITTTNSKYKEIFIIEDISLASYYFNEKLNDWVPFNICETKEFEILWKRHVEVQFIVLETNQSYFVMKHPNNIDYPSYKNLKTFVASGGVSISSTFKI